MDVCRTRIWFRLLIIVNLMTLISCGSLNHNSHSKRDTAPSIHIPPASNLDRLARNSTKNTSLKTRASNSKNTPKPSKSTNRNTEMTSNTITPTFEKQLDAPNPRQQTPMAENNNQSSFFLGPPPFLPSPAPPMIQSTTQDNSATVAGNSPSPQMPMATNNSPSDFYLGPPPVVPTPAAPMIPPTTPGIPTPVADNSPPSPMPMMTNNSPNDFYLGPPPVVPSPAPPMIPPNPQSNPTPVAGDSPPPPLPMMTNNNPSDFNLGPPQIVPSSESSTISPTTQSNPLGQTSSNGFMGPLAPGQSTAMAQPTERIMVLEPEHPSKFAWVSDIVHNLVSQIKMIKQVTEQYVLDFNRKYDDLPLVKEDNDKWKKYSRAVVETFVLDFTKDYLIEGSLWGTLSSINFYDDDAYKRSYDVALSRLREKKSQTAIQFAVPVRRSWDILRAIMDIPVGLVQSGCKDYLPPWYCEALYLVKVVEESDDCEFIWHHSLVHLNFLHYSKFGSFRPGLQEPGDILVNKLEAELMARDQGNEVGHLFDFIVQTLESGDIEGLRDSLVIKAGLMNLVRTLQNENLLQCMKIDVVQTT